MRGRGLKQVPADVGENQQASPAMRGRGLKLILRDGNIRSLHVARHARAWIETWEIHDVAVTARVARHARAWIETQFNSAMNAAMTVARHARAWIETVMNCS